MGTKKRGRGLFFAATTGGKYFFLKKIKGDYNFSHQKKGGFDIFSGCIIEKLFIRIILLAQIEDNNTYGRAGIVVFCSMKHTKVIKNGLFEFQSAFDMTYSKRGVGSFFGGIKGVDIIF